MSIYFFSEGGKEDYKQKSIRKTLNQGTMDQEKLICIRDTEDQSLRELQSQGYRITQISASGIYCWILLVKYDSCRPTRVGPDQVTQMISPINPVSL